ncbi:MAG TPA: hypothetical protein VJ397_04015, partial [Thermoplasmata archaeon]|nr:hypothetical protein [Thermoplasmata archaeon]
RRLGPDAGVAMGSGIALIVGGSLMCSFVLGAILPAAWFVLMAAAIASAVVSYRMGFGREAPAPSMPYAQPVIPPR